MITIIILRIPKRDYTQYTVKVLKRMNQFFLVLTALLIPIVGEGCTRTGETVNVLHVGRSWISKLIILVLGYLV